MRGLILQNTPDFCSAGYSLGDYLFEFRFIDAFACTSSEMAGGFTTVATLVFGGIALSIYIRTGSVALPGILALLTGGVVLSVLAPPALTIATVLILVLGAGALAYAYYRFSR